MQLNKLLVSKYTVAGVFVAICVFTLTLLIAPYYIHGDQRSYIAVYEKLSSMGFNEGYEYYNNWLTSKEYVHYAISWLGSGIGVEKNFVMGISNALLAYFSIRLIEKWGASIALGIMIVLTNFYMFVVYFAAERLKFGILFLVISMLYLGKHKRFYTLAAVAMFAHVQVLLFYVSMFFTQMMMSLARFFRTFQFSMKKILLLVILVGPIAFFLADYILQKVGKYSYGIDVTANVDYKKITLLLILSLWYSKNKKETLLMFVPMMMAVSVVGSDRVNMMAYFVFLYYGLRYKGGLNFGVLVTTAYFAIKSYGFVFDIINYGDGFETMVSQLQIASQSIYI
jgi:hypothetical protein